MCEFCHKNQRKINTLEKTIKELRTRCHESARDKFDNGMFAGLHIVGAEELGGTEEIASLRNQIRNANAIHESDCITINQLQTTIDVLVDKLARLREVHGL